MVLKESRLLVVAQAPGGADDGVGSGLEEGPGEPGEERPGRGNSRMVIGATEVGRILRVLYSPDPDPHALFVITA